MQIDARGKACPQPVMLAEEALGRIAEGIMEVLVDNEESALNVSSYASQKGMYVETRKEGKDWLVKVVKGYVCKTSSESGVQSSELETKKKTGSESGVGSSELETKKKTLMLIVGTDSLGKDEDLGKKLMKGYFETMKVYKQLPDMIFFLNAGVKLTTVNEETAAVIKDIEALGVEVYSCGTCLKHYDIESKLKVGHRGTTNHIVEGMQDFDKIVWI